MIDLRQWALACAVQAVAVVISVSAQYLFRGVDA